MYGNRRNGFTLLELLIALAVAGILLGVAITQLNPNGAATRQAAQVVASAINEARFEAVRTNNTAGFVVVAGSGGTSGYVATCIEVDESVSPLSCDSGVTQNRIDFDSGDLSRAVITSPSETTVFFDRRGIVRNPGSVSEDITITDRSGGNIRTVNVLPTGRTEVN